MVTGVGAGFHRGINLKVTGRSNQLQMGENNLFLLALLQFSSLEMSMVVETHLDPSGEL